MTAILLLLTIALGGAHIFRGFKRSDFGKSTWWFVVLNTVFFLPSFTFAWIRDGSSEQSSVAVGLQVLCLGLGSFIIGGLWTKRSSGHEKHLSRLQTLNPDSADRSRSAARALKMVDLGVLIPAWTYFALLGSVPLFMGVSDAVTLGYGGLGSLQSHRLEATPHLAGIVIPFKGLLDLARNYGTLFIVGIAITQLLLGFSKRLRLASIAIAIVTALAGGQRWPMIYVIVAVCMSSFSMVSSGARPPAKQTVRILAILGTIGVTISALQNRLGEQATTILGALKSAVLELTNRIFVEQSLTPLLSFQQDSYLEGELRGASYLQSLMAYIPGSSIQNFEVDFFSRIYGGSYGYTAAPGFFVEAYINFGRIGVILISLAWGVFLSQADKWAQEHAHGEFWPGFTAAILTLLACTSFAGAGLVLSVVVVSTLIYACYRVAVPARSAQHKRAASFTHRRLLKHEVTTANRATSTQDLTLT